MNRKYSYVLKLYLILPVFLLASQLHGQTPSTDENIHLLSLDDAVNLAVEQNFTLEQAEYDLDKTQAQYRQTHAVFLPQISFEYNAISTNDPLNVFGFKLKQEIVGQQDFDPARLNNPESFENYSAKFEVRQPLFNPDMMLQRNAVQNQLHSVNEQLEGTKRHVQFQVRDQYYSLILHTRQLEVIESALQTAGEHRRQAENFYEEGLISKEDFLAASVYELEMKSRKLNTENQLRDVRENLALMLGLDGSHEIIPSDSLTYVPPPRFSGDVASSEIDNAQTRAMEYRVQSAESQVRASTFSFLPKINLFGSYEFNDHDFAGFTASSYMIGANLRWNIFSGFSKAGKAMEARADLRKAQSMQRSHSLEQQNNVRQALRSLEHARQELELTRESIRQSTENVKIRSNRYREGLERTTDLLEAETSLAEARLKNVMALYKYNMSLATLNLLLETNL